MIGKRFERWKVISFCGKNKHGNRLYECYCDCGNIKIVAGFYLRNGDSKSCGCYGAQQRAKSRTSHGMSGKKISEYEIWKGMKARCYNVKHSGYIRYGGAGVIVCERWRNSFSNFISDMGERPTSVHSLDRFPDMNGNYEPSNCRWATRGEQARNKKNNRFFSKNGLTMVLKDWADLFNVHDTTLMEHLKTKSFNDVFNFYAKDNEGLYHEIEEKVTQLLSNQH